MSDLPLGQPLPSGIETEPEPELPSSVEEYPSVAEYRGTARLAGKVALVSGGESGIGRAVAVGLAREGADVAITYLDEHQDAQETVRLIAAEERQALAIPGDVGNSDFAREVVRQTVAAFGRIDVLVNSATEQRAIERLEDLTDAQLERNFRTSIFSQFFLTRSALPEMPDGSAVINTAVLAAREDGEPFLDHASLTGAVTSFTRWLARQLASRRIRVNAIVLGPVCAPPDAVAPSYLFLASRDAAYVSGEILHANGDEVANG